MSAIAKGNIVLGSHGEIKAGQEIPESFLDSLGHTIKTDFERLERLGLADLKKVAKRVKKDAPAVEHDAQVVAQVAAEAATVAAKV